MLYILQESIKVSLLTVSLEQLIYLFLTRSCLFPIPSRNLQRHPCPVSTWKSELFEQRRLRVLRDPGLELVKKRGGSCGASSRREKKSNSRDLFVFLSVLC
jgi:hypothetical protein